MIAPLHRNGAAPNSVALPENRSCRSRPLAVEVLCSASNDSAVVGENVMTRPLVLRQTPEAALVQRIIEICFQPKDQAEETILRMILWRAIQGKVEFRPHLVALDGEIVGAVPDGVDRLLMKLHLAHKELNHDAARSTTASATHISEASTAC